ncbi:MAG: hypothetical protein CL958_09275 [Euryarchaeota archaeon]|nr:hypothetical protein [Marinobacter sp.]|tara:strand:- start:26788 stop:28569 length:1782 start_codon:yes stop_codon:yes gene_type:complete
MSMYKVNLVTRLELTIHYALMTALIVVAFCVPYHFIPIGSFIEEFIAGGAAVIGGVIAWAYMPRERQVSQATVLWLIWGGVLLISFLGADYSMVSSGYWVLIYWFVGLLAIVWIGRLSSEMSVAHVIEVIALLFVFSALAQSILGVAKFYGLLRGYWIFEAGTTRLPGLINQYNLTASSLMIGMASLFYLYFKGKVGLFCAFLVIYVTSFAAILTDTRSILLYVAIIFIALWFVYGDDERIHKKRVAAIVIAAAMTSLLAFISVKPVDAFLESIGPDDLRRISLEDSVSTRDLSDLGIRVSEAKKIVAGIGHDLWLGVGPGNYSAYTYIWDDYVEDARRPGSLPTHSHNLFTMVMAEEGVLGLLVLLILISCVGWHLWVKKKNAEWFWLVSFFGILFVYSNVEYPLWYMQYLVVFLGICSLVLPSIRFKVDSRVIGYGLSAVALAVFGFLGLNLSSGYWDLVQADSKSYWGSDTVQTVRSWQGDTLLGPYATLLSYQRLLPSESEYERESELVERMMLWRPHNLVLVRKIQLLILSGDMEKACEISEKAIRFYKSVYFKLEADLPVIEKYRDIDVSPYRKCMVDAVTRYHNDA